MLGLTEIGQSITSARKEKRLTQLQLAKKAGVSQKTMDLLENGRATEIGYSRLVRILAALGLELRLQALSTERPTLDELLKEGSADV